MPARERKGREPVLGSGLFPVGRRGVPGLPVEDSAEIKGILIAHKIADFLNGVIGVFQQLFCLADPDGGKVLHGGDSHIAFEAADKPAYAHVLVFCVFLDTDIL